MGAIQALYRIVVSRALSEQDRPSKEDLERELRHTACSIYDCDKFSDSRSITHAGVSLCTEHMNEYDAILRLGHNHPQFRARMESFHARCSRRKQSVDDFLRSIGYL